MPLVERPSEAKGKYVMAMVTDRDVVLEGASGNPILKNKRFPP